MCVCVCACVSACVRACVRECVRACVRVLVLFHIICPFLCLACYLSSSMLPKAAFYPSRVLTNQLSSMSRSYLCSCKSRSCSDFLFATILIRNSFENRTTVIQSKPWARILHEAECRIASQNSCATSSFQVVA